MFYDRRRDPRYEERLYGEPSDDEESDPDSSDAETAVITPAERRAKDAAIAEDDMGGYGVNFVEYNLVLGALWTQHCCAICGYPSS